MKIKSTIPLIILLSISFFGYSQTQNNHFGTIIFNLKFSSFSESGSGGKVKIKSMTTGKEFSGKSPQFNSQIIIENLPKGIYKVVELLIKTGSGQIHYYDSLKLNQIEINEGKTFYLGTYRTKKTSEFFKLNYKISLDKNIDTVKIKKQSLKITGIENNIDFTQKLFKSDTTYFNIK